MGASFRAVRALITDVDVRSPVHGLRGLGRAGIGAIAVAPTKSGAGLWSRYATHRAVAPAARADPGGFRARIAELTARQGPLVVYPGNETSLDVLGADRAWLPPGSVLACPDRAVLERVRDKGVLAELAPQVGLRTPATLAAGTAGGLGSVHPPLPCVVKPARPHPSGHSARVAHSSAELAAILRQLPGDERVLVQERVAGPLVAVAVVLDRDGALAARFQQVARRTWPPDAGDSSVAVSVAPDEDLVERAAELLRSAGYAGLAQLQFVRTDRGHALIDVNPRFYGSLPLALAAGANLPAAWHAVASGEEPPRPVAYRIGLTYRWFTGELMTARRVSPRVLLERPPPPRVGSVWAADDPAPAAALVARELAAPLRRRLVRGRG